MFTVSETDAHDIRAIFSEEGEFAAAVELRRRYPGLLDNERAKQMARTIAGRRPVAAAVSENVVPLQHGRNPRLA